VKTWDSNSRLPWLLLLGFLTVFHRPGFLDPVRQVPDEVKEEVSLWYTDDLQNTHATIINDVLPILVRPSSQPPWRYLIGDLDEETEAL